jgi:predicted membrane metal-binding protein
MENNSASWEKKTRVRYTLLIIVIVLLNFGLFFILNLIAPLAVGLFVGFFIAKPKDSLATTFFGTTLSYSIVFLITEWYLGFANAAIDVVIAVIIMGVIGTVGGLIGAILSIKTHT